MRRLLTILPLVALLAACAALGLRSPVGQDDLRGMERIAVVSTLGDRYHGILVGLTSFGNQYYGADVRDWDIDALATRTALERMNGAGLTARAAALELAGSRGEAFHRAGDYRDIDRARLLSLAAAQGFDTLVLIHPAADENLPDRAGGYGYQAGFGIGGISGCSYVQLIVEVLRVRDAQQLGWDWARDCDDREDPGWRAGLEEYAPVEREALRALTQAQVAQQVRARVEWLGLAQTAAGPVRSVQEPPPGLFRRD